MKEQYQYDETELECPHCEDDMTLLGIDHSDKQSFWNCPTCEQSYGIEYGELFEVETQQSKILQFPSMVDDNGFSDFLTDNYPVNDRVQMPHEIQAKQQALDHYNEVSTPKQYVQIDGFTSPDGIIDSIINPDGQRNSVAWGTSFELWRGDYTLRLHVNPNADKADVIELLEDILKYAKESETFFDLPEYPDEPPF